MIDHPLLIHPERAAESEQSDRGIVEVLGYPGGWREWIAYDAKGEIRIRLGKNDRDVHGQEVARMEADLERMEQQDREREA